MTPRIYQDTPLSLDQELTLSVDASRHVLNVLRLRVSDPLVVFNGQGGEYHAELLGNANRLARVRLIAFCDVSRESPASISLGVGLLRGDRMDYAVKKSVELGVAAITPLFTEKCQVKLTGDRVKKRLAHWQQIAISAAEQSGRTSVPVIYAPAQLNDWINMCDGLRFICDFTDETDMPANKASQAMHLLIGPESGFTSSETTYAHQQGFQSLLLGPRVLRAETAPVVALTKLQMRYGDII